MSRQASSRTIGAFVLGSIAIVIAGAVVFGSGEFFRNTNSFYMYFDESLKGLRVGAPVAFRGVPVGQVASIQAMFDDDDVSVIIPVRVDTVEGSIKDDAADRWGSDEERTDALIDRGLRGKLQMESLVTGQLFIALDFYPDTDVVLRSKNPDEVEVPTLPSDWARLQRSVDGLAVSGPVALERIERIVGRIDSLLGADEVNDLVASLGALASAFKEIGNPDGSIATSISQLPEVMSDLTMATDELPALIQTAEKTLLRFDLLLANADSSLVSRDTVLGNSIGKAGDAAEATRRMADQVNNMVAENRSGLNDFSEIGVPELLGLIEDTTRMINEMDATLRDLRQDPSRFLFGNSTSEGVTIP